MSETKRQTELDILRLLATLAVIMTHLCGGPVKSLDVYSSNWSVLNCLRAAVTWDVPIFVMISGSLFLKPSKEVTIRKIYQKYIKHLVICFCFWSAVFQILYYFTGDCSLNWKGILSEFLIGPYPFWYLFMLAGLYMLIPFIRRFVDDKKLLEYFLLLFILSEFIANYGACLPYLGELISTIFNKMVFHFTLGFVGYYILGYYLVTYSVSDNVERALYVLGVLCAVFSCVGTTLQSRQQGVYNEWFSKYLMPNVIVESAAVFTFFVKRVGKMRISAKLRTALEDMSVCGMGVYLIHALIIEGLNFAGITVVSMSPFVMVPVLTVAVYLASFFATKLIRKIPFVGKKIT